jgi:amino-acid N-acetyltransferase
MHIRKAVVRDVKIIHQILNHYADQGLLLPRSLSEFYDHIRDYLVLENDCEGGSIHGVCGLGICWEDLAEIKSLAVSEGQRGKGFGFQLVEACLNEARALGLKRVFTLTYIPGFFVRLGFEEIEKSYLPHKIWADCLKCPKFPHCDETALMIDL